MPEQLERKSLDSPDEIRFFKDNKGTAEIVTVGSVTIGRVLNPDGFGINTSSLSQELHPARRVHTVYIFRGTRMVVKMDDGSEDEFGPGDAFYMPAGHDAWIVGDEPCVLIDIMGFDKYAKPS